MYTHDETRNSAYKTLCSAWRVGSSSMATSVDFIEFVSGQLRSVEPIGHKKTFGAPSIWDIDCSDFSKETVLLLASVPPLPKLRKRKAKAPWFPCHCAPDQEGLMKGRRYAHV